MTQQPTQAPPVAEALRLSKHAFGPHDENCPGCYVERARDLLGELACQLEQAEREKERYADALHYAMKHSKSRDVTQKVERVLLGGSLSEQNTKPSDELGEEA